MDPPTASVSIDGVFLSSEEGISLCFADEIFIFEFLRIMVAVQVLAKKHQSTGCSGDVGIRISRLYLLSLR